MIVASGGYGCRYTVADIDLDLFLERFDNIDCGRHRQPSTLGAWSPERLRLFLEEKCGFNPRRGRIPGRFIVDHDEAFDIIGALAARHGAFDLIHMDSHADLGTGMFDRTWVDVGSRLLGVDCHQRPAAILREGDAKMSPANYLAFVLACRWLKSLIYVHHPSGGDDLMPFFFRDFDVATNVIEMRFVPEGIEAAIQTMSPDRLRQLPHRLEPAIPFQKISSTQFAAATPFDFIIVCQSPGYTPIETDKLIPVLSDYIDFEIATGI
ncbi:hypothetical protein YH63_008280 [Afipia massiliensis]|uniref:Uncharacterized protein n=1 Tax=Afipia massiliensis TaxID=211460 RepID=A0A4U6BM15_9BRAD|nr:UPF0489 family protein [Afipia massiliensis]TKT71410.1 hypothetical protein YH63_008280 [Afipia massiliensis]